ncbi:MULTISPECIES: DNA polymerase III subunit delta [unclassified Pseudactinotalea]|uniref:DNA polymerase III subunit delta n=1 Tax=Micrococcales TaxID=85006 RepID=UPI003C7DADCC
MAPPRRRSASEALTWKQAPLAPVVLVRGAESVLADRALERIAGLVREHAAAGGSPQVEQTVLEADTYESGQLDMVASPSLFAEPRHIVVTAVESASDAFITDGLAYLDRAGDQVEDVTLVLRHAKGNRGKKLLDAVAARYPVVQCDPIKRDADKAAFVAEEFRDAGRRATSAAVQTLVEAVGSDLRELAAAARQLIADTAGSITPDVVDRYYGGRVEATGFRVADTAIAGDGTAAVTLLRHALSTGVDPVLLVAALAMKVRTLAKVAAGRSRGATAAELGLAPWQLDRARRELRGWTPEGLATAIAAVADADAQVKGAGRDPEFAVERAVLTVAQARHG